ncbi:cadherin-like domain-containing protein [Vibrio lentus]|nr:cadherin-like domain-containing protein [Vibrio lentus]
MHLHVEGDDLTASGLTVGGDATVPKRRWQSFTITPDANFIGDIDISFDISDAYSTRFKLLPDSNPLTQSMTCQFLKINSSVLKKTAHLSSLDADPLTGATDIEGDNLTVEGMSTMAATVFLPTTVMARTPLKRQ